MQSKLSESNKLRYDRLYSLGINPKNVYNFSYRLKKIKKVRKIFFESKKGVLLDLGFGFGYLSAEFADAYQIYGIDISKNAIHAAQKTFIKKKTLPILVTYDINDALPYKDKIFDIVLASHVMEHLENYHLLIREIARVLKKDGIVIILIPQNELGLPDFEYKELSAIELKREFKEFDVIFEESNFESLCFFDWINDNTFRNPVKKAIAEVTSLIYSLIPILLLESIEKIMKWLNFKPRQYMVVLKKGSS